MYLRRVTFVIGITMAMALTGCSGSGSSDDGQDPADPPEDSAPPEDPDPPEEEPPEGPPATLTVDDVTVHEDDGPVTFIVRVDGAEEADDVRVDYASADGSATAASDYVAGAGTLQFLEGTTAQTVTIEILDDSEPEGSESFSLQLDNPLNAEIARETGEATIVDDDVPDVCGSPEMDESADADAFLWKHCPSGNWRLRATAANEELRYAGNVTAAEPFTDVTPVGLEAGDVVDTPGPQEIEFSLSVAGDSDGFNFAMPDDAGTCLDLQLPADTPVLVGQDRTPVTTPFDLATLQACDEEPQPPDGPEQPNIVVLFTDDQRLDTIDMTIGGMDVMPNVKQRLLPKAVKFENAYVPIPLCCPARASTYSGGFLAQDTGVIDNQPPNGGMQAYDDSDNIGTRLQEAGYRTMFIGKWLNDYPNHTPYVPPGWDSFVGRSVWANGADWDQFEYVFGSTGQSSGVGEERGSDGQYHPYFERDRIIDFVEQAPDDEPFMVFWSATAPHMPAVADEQDRNAFSDFSYRGRGYGEEDLSDKPRWVTSPGRPIGDDEEVRSQVRSLLSLDRALGHLLDALAAQGELDETVFIVTSDNGYMWGEHGVWTKGKPYEESIRVPLLIVMPGIEPRGDDHLVSAVLDLGPTLYDIAGTSGPSQGTSLLPLLRDPSISWRDELFFEHYGIKRNLLDIWAGIRRGQWKYVKYWYGDEELYDLEADPFELENRARDPAVEQVKSSLEDRVDEMLGLAIHPVPVWTDNDGQVGEPYHLAIESWGGEPPFEWTVESGRLPPGLRLNEATGEVSGTPTSAGTWTFQLRVTGSSLAIQVDRPQTYVSADITIRID